MRGAERASGLIELGGANVTERAAGQERWLGDGAGVAAGEGHHDPRLSLDGRVGEQPSCQQCFIVGMGTDDHQRRSHRATRT
jgi:hypothetical protein